MRARSVAIDKHGLSKSPLNQIPSEGHAAVSRMWPAVVLTETKGDEGMRYSSANVPSSAHSTVCTFFLLERAQHGLPSDDR